MDCVLCGCIVMDCQNHSHNIFLLVDHRNLLEERNIYFQQKHIVQNYYRKASIVTGHIHL